MERTLGGDRLGSGKKQKIYMREFERSNHDIGFVFRTTMAPGTLVPFMSEVALPGDTFDINLNLDVLTHPTIGPLFGTFKAQLDCFQVPMRLYNAKLHMNMLNIGMNMKTVGIPQFKIWGARIDVNQPLDNQQIASSCIFKYLGVSGVGYEGTSPTENDIQREFNAIPYLGYWDIYKNYYANKQEEIGMVIHRDVARNNPGVTDANIIGGSPTPFTIPIGTTPTYSPILMNAGTYLLITASNPITVNEQASDFKVYLELPDEGGSYYQVVLTLDQVFSTFSVDTVAGTMTASNPVYQDVTINIGAINWDGNNVDQSKDAEPQISQFPLKNIDDMRQAILSDFSDAGYLIDDSTPAPYGLPLMYNEDGAQWSKVSAQWAQEGLALKTYQSDLFNNWISTEWIDGPDGISAITAVDVTGGSFTIDELNLSKKVYDMLNRIALSGGSYDDWLDAVYTHDRIRTAESPIYLGGLMQRIVFQEVVSNAATTDEPLGSLAGRGRLSQDRKGGKIIVKVDEPSYIIGIVSLTPYIDYSQGNKWDVNLKTIDDLHKPNLDEIGFQDLITDQMAWFDTAVNAGLPTYKSAGKQPAWINYMTNVNKVFGNFADETQQMFMVLNRRYNPKFDSSNRPSIGDLTTYIDPVKFNYAFADTRRDAQNFWVQIGCNIEARRKMSARVIPNL